MFKKILGITTIVGFGALASGQAFAKCDPDPCPEGQTCRYEQPNTYECKSYNNVYGSQGAFDQQGAGQPSGQGYRAPNRDLQRGQRGQVSRSAAFKGSDCAGSKRACVDVLINNKPYSVASIIAAAELALTTRLRGERLTSLQIAPNPAALENARGQRAALAQAMGRASAFRFVERPRLPDIMNIHDLMPPLDFLRRIDPMTGANLDKLQAQYGFAAMQAAIQEIKDIAMASGGNAAPILLFGMTYTELAIASAMTLTAIDKAIALLEKALGDDEDEAEEDKKSKDGDGSGGEEGEKIIAEKDWPMVMALYKTYRLMVRSWNQTLRFRF